MKITFEELISRFNKISNINNEIIGYFYATNYESYANTSSFSFHRMKEDHFYFALSQDGIYIDIERRYPEDDVVFVKSGFYSWNVIKLLELYKNDKNNRLKFIFADGKELLVNIELINDDVRNLLLSKECQPNIHDEEFKKNKARIDKHKLIGTIISIILGIIFFAAVGGFRGCF